jgi:hypothetical protein
MARALARPFNLTAALAVTAVAELVLHRLLERLFLPQHPAGVARVAAEAGRFAFHLSGVLGLLLVVVALMMALRDQNLFPRSMRFAVATIALFFVALSALGVLALPFPDRLLVHLKTSHAFLAWFIVVALWRMPGATRAKMGVTLFALPSLLHAFALFADRLGWARPFPAELERAAVICALMAGALSPLLLAPEPTSGRRGLAGAAAGVLSLTILLGALLGRFDLVHTLALYGFNLELPPPATSGAITYAALVIAAFVGMAMSVVWNFTDGGGARLTGYGLVLLAMAGYQTAAPNQILFATAGLLALAGGTTRLTPRPAAPILDPAAAGM